MVLSRLLAFVARAKSASVTRLRFYSRAVMVITAIGDIVHPPPPPPYPPPIPSPPSLHFCAFLTFVSSACLRLVSAATSPAAATSSPPCAKQPRQNRLSRQVLTPCTSSTHPTITSPPGNASLGLAIAQDVSSTRNTAYAAAGLQPTCEAATGLLIVAAFIAAAGNLTACVSRCVSPLSHGCSVLLVSAARHTARAAVDGQAHFKEPHT